MDRGRGHRAASKLAESLEKIWSSTRQVDPWEIVGHIFEEAWELVRNDYFCKENDILIDTDWKDDVEMVYS